MRVFLRVHPEFKLWIVGNHKPSLRQITPAWRRRLIIPTARHRPRGSGSLAHGADGRACSRRYAIRRSSAWRPADGSPADENHETLQLIATGGCRPQRVQPTEADGRGCSLGDSFASSRTLFASWQGWAKEAGERAGNEKALVQALKEAGYRSTRKNRTGPRGFEGLAVAMLQNLRNE